MGSLFKSKYKIYDELVQTSITVHASDINNVKKPDKIQRFLCQ